MTNNNLNLLEELREHLLEKTDYKLSPVKLDDIEQSLSHWYYFKISKKGLLGKFFAEAKYSPAIPQDLTTGQKEDKFALYLFTNRASQGELKDLEELVGKKFEDSFEFNYCKKTHPVVEPIIIDRYY